MNSTIKEIGISSIKYNILCVALCEMFRLENDCLGVLQQQLWFQMENKKKRQFGLLRL